MSTTALRVTGVNAGVPVSKPSLGPGEHVSTKELEYLMEDATTRLQDAAAEGQAKSEQEQQQDDQMWELAVNPALEKK